MGRRGLRKVLSYLSQGMTGPYRRGCQHRSTGPHLSCSLPSPSAGTSWVLGRNLLSDSGGERGPSKCHRTDRWGLEDLPVELWNPDPQKVFWPKEQGRHCGGGSALGRAVGLLASAPLYLLDCEKRRKGASRQARTQTDPSRQPVPSTKNPPPALPRAGASVGLEDKHVTARPGRRTAGAKNRRKL